MSTPNYAPANSVAFQVPSNVVLAPEFKQFLIQFNDLYSQLANAVNAKDTGIYDLQEIITGQRFYNQTNTQTKRETFRKSFPFTTIAAGATLVIPLLISNLGTLTRIYGTAIDVGGIQRPLPYSSVVNINQNIEVNISAGNANIIVGAGSPNVSSGLLILEYLKT